MSDRARSAVRPRVPERIPPLPQDRNEALARTPAGELAALGDRGARVDSLSPGIIMTPLALDELNSPAGALYQEMIKASASGRVGTLDEIGTVAAFLMGRDGSFITGSDLLIDGGVIASIAAGRYRVQMGRPGRSVRPGPAYPTPEGTEAECRLRSVGIPATQGKVMPETPHPTTSESVQPPSGVSGPRVPAGQVERPGAPPPARSGARPHLRGHLTRLLPSLGPGLLMGVIGAVGATRPVLSWDEVATADVVRRSTGQIWAMIHNVDAAHGTYYFLVHAWTRLAGTSVWDLRLPSIAAMAVAVGLAGELGRRLFSPLVGGLAGLFLCLIPNSSRYAAEARPYAFTCLLSVLAVLLLHRALRRPGAARWFGYGLSVVLLGLSHIVALTTLAAHAVAVGYQWRRHRAWRTPAAWAATVLVALAMLVPLFWLIAGQRETAFWPDPITPGRLGAAPAALIGSRPAAWLLIGLALLAAWRPIDRMVEVTALVLAPPAALAVISVLVQPLWVPRYLLVVLAPLALLAAIATVRADPAGPVRLLRILVVLAVVAATVYPGQRAVRKPTAKNGADYRGAVRLLQRHGLPGDAILYHDRSRTLRAGVDYYQLGAAYRPQDVLLRRPAAQSASLIAEEYPDVAIRLAGVQRVWLMVNDHPTDPTVRKPAARGVLRADFQQVARWRIAGATLALYQRRG